MILDKLAACRRGRLPWEEAGGVVGTILYFIVYKQCRVGCAAVDDIVV